MAKDNAQRGRDVSAPERTVTINDVQYTLVFSNRAARLAEDVYSEQYGRDMGYFDILDELSRRRYRAIMAIVYGALLAGGASLSWDEYDGAFTITSMDAVRQADLDGVVQALPDSEGGNATKKIQRHRPIPLGMADVPRAGRGD